MVWRAGRSGSFLRPIDTIISAMASSILPSSFLTIFWSIGHSSQRKPLIILDGLHTLVHRKSVKNANPFLSCVTHGIEGERAVTEGFYPGKHPLERGREGIRTWAGEGREE